MILTIIISVCMFGTFVVMQRANEAENLTDTKAAIKRASMAYTCGGLVSMVFLFGVLSDITSGELKPYGGMGFNVFRIVPRLNGDEATQYKFHAMLEEYSWWGRRKKGEWPARWISGDMEWEIYRDKEWRRIEMAGGSEDNISWDNRGPHEE